MKNTSLSKSISRLKRCLAAFLVLSALPLLASCRREEKRLDFTDREGGCSFSYPESWEAYRAGGGVCLSVSEVGGPLPYAMVRFSVFDNERGLSASAYWNDGKKDFGTVCESFKILQKESSPFEKEGTASAYRAETELSLKGETRLYGQPKKANEAAAYRVSQLIFESPDKKRLCVVTYMSRVGYYTIYGSVMDDIRESFRFENPVGSETVTDKGLSDFELKTPEGWTLAESEAYRILKRGKATIAVCVYSMEKNMTAEQYWEEVYRGAVTAGLAGFEEISSEARTLDGEKAIDVHYKGSSVSGTVYDFRQLIAVREAQAYVVTLTASEADYKDACEGFERAAEGFAFK